MSRTRNHRKDRYDPPASKAGRKRRQQDARRERHGVAKQMREGSDR